MHSQHSSTKLPKYLVNDVWDGVSDLIFTKPPPNSQKMVGQSLANCGQWLEMCVFPCHLPMNHLSTGRDTFKAAFYSGPNRKIHRSLQFHVAQHFKIQGPRLANCCHANHTISQWFHKLPTIGLRYLGCYIIVHIILI